MPMSRKATRPMAAPASARLPTDGRKLAGAESCETAKKTPQSMRVGAAGSRGSRKQNASHAAAVEHPRGRRASGGWHRMVNHSVSDPPQDEEHISPFRAKIGRAHV